MTRCTTTSPSQRVSPRRRPYDVQVILMGAGPLIITNKWLYNVNYCYIYIYIYIIYIYISYFFLCSRCVENFAGISGNFQCLRAWTHQAIYILYLYTYINIYIDQRKFTQQTSELWTNLHDQSSRHHVFWEMDTVVSGHMRLRQEKRAHLWLKG